MLFKVQRQQIIAENVTQFTPGTGAVYDNARHRSKHILQFEDEIDLLGTVSRNVDGAGNMPLTIIIIRTGIQKNHIPGFEHRKRL